MAHTRHNRLPFLHRFAPLFAVLTLAFGAAMNAAEKPLTIGFIYVGPRDDYGYNQAHAEGAAVVKKLPGVTVREEE
ncbi:MAG TPA: BMP family ABC transporter substrate-binding protein, partial [Planctomycetota bacterium]|nr:BMP family ABC transporter substrate-binding protein [Planctomycetota bacterium]